MQSFALVPLAVVFLPFAAVAQISAPAVPSDELWPAELRTAIAACWNIGAMPPSVQAGAVTLAVRFDDTGTPVADGLRMVGFERMTQTEARLGYEAARRAVIRCGTSGYPLPAARRALWQELQLTFDPNEGASP